MLPNTTKLLWSTFECRLHNSVHLLWSSQLSCFKSPYWIQYLLPKINYCIIMFIGYNTIPQDFINAFFSNDFIKRIQLAALHCCVCYFAQQQFISKWQQTGVQLPIRIAEVLEKHFLFTKFLCRHSDKIWNWTVIQLPEGITLM